MNEGAVFDFKVVPPGHLEYKFEENMVKIKGAFGTINDVDLAEYKPSPSSLIILFKLSPKL